MSQPNRATTERRKEATTTTSTILCAEHAEPRWNNWVLRNKMDSFTRSLVHFYAALLAAIKSKCEPFWISITDKFEKDDKCRKSIYPMWARNIQSNFLFFCCCLGLMRKVMLLTHYIKWFCSCRSESIYFKGIGLYRRSNGTCTIGYKSVTH